MTLFTYFIVVVFNFEATVMLSDLPLQIVSPAYRHGRKYDAHYSTGKLRENPSSKEIKVSVATTSITDCN